MGSTCYSVELTADITPRLRAPRRLEAIGHWSFTQNGNSVHASGSIFRETRRGDIVQSFGDLQAAINDVDGTTTLFAVVNGTAEVVDIPSR